MKIRVMLVTKQNVSKPDYWLWVWRNTAFKWNDREAAKSFQLPLF